ncbi:hypothetical protein B0H13DRAFT_2284184 [Mycena leptocephala]|nr:hypothetical protein B0H13DRAFT_2284184 [Mycena leptocephala]
MARRPRRGVGRPQPLFMLKTATRLAFTRRKTRWMVSLRRVSPTTRKDQPAAGFAYRLGSKGLYLSLTRYRRLHQLQLLLLLSIRPPHSRRKPSAWWSKRRTPTLRTHSLDLCMVPPPLRFTGLLSQLLLNQRSKTYGGSYKITAAFQCICGVLQLLKYVPSVIGRYDARRVSRFRERWT